MSGRHLKFLWGRLNSNFWFVLTLLTAASLLLFGVMQYLDQTFVSSVSGLSLTFSGGPSAARSTGEAEVAIRR